MSATAKIAFHEFKTTTANKTFAVITIIGPFLILAIAILPGMFAQAASGIESGTTIGILVPDNTLYSELQKSAADLNLGIRKIDTTEQGGELIRDGSIQGYLIIPASYITEKTYSYVSKTGTDYMIAQGLESVLANIVVTERLSEAGLDPALVASLTERPSVSVQKVGQGEEVRQNFMSIMMTALGFVMILYMTLIFYGQMIGYSIIMEKTSKTVEILLSSARPMEIMFGKILGKGCAGLLQYTVWIGAALLLTYFIGPWFNLTLPPALSVGNLAFLLLFFMLAFFLYAGGYAAIGSAAENEQHMGQLSWPLLVGLIIPVMMISGIIMNPDSTAALVLTFIPFTAPVIMLTRILVTNPPIWQIVLVIVEMVLSIAGMIWISSRIFRIGILMTGKRFEIREILRWINS